MERKIGREEMVCWVCGILTGLCLVFTQMGPAVFFLPAPALAVCMRRQRGKGLWLGCAAFSMGLCMGGYSLAFCIQPAVEERWIFWLDLLVYMVGCVLHGAVLAAALWWGLRLRCPAFFRWGCLSLFWALGEWMIGAGPFAWPTLRLCLALWKYPALIQWARWFGQLGVSALIMSVNALLASGLCRLRGKRAFLPVMGALILFSGNLLPGLFLPEGEGKELTAALIQPGMSTAGETEEDIHRPALALAREAAEQSPDLILLPESVLPYDFPGDPTFGEDWANLARETGADILVGGALEGHSALFRFSPDGQMDDVYQKQREVPFFENGVGERPFRWGTGLPAGAFSLKLGKTAVLICYESLFPSMARDAVKNGARLLAVSTNDSWFAAQKAKDLHLAHGVFRAVETGRPLAQAGLDGRTAAASPYGRIVAALPSGEAGILYVRIQLVRNDTLYLVLGDWWLFFCLAAVMAQPHMARFRKKRRDRTG